MGRPLEGIDNGTIDVVSETPNHSGDKRMGGEGYAGGNKTSSIAGGGLNTTPAKGLSVQYNNREAVSFVGDNVKWSNHTDYTQSGTQNYTTVERTVTYNDCISQCYFLKVLLVLLAVLPFLLQAIGFVSPSWLHMKSGGISVLTGLFYTYLCDGGGYYGACKTKSFAEISEFFGTESVQQEMTKYQVMASFALFASLVANVVVYNYFSRRVTLDHKVSIYRGLTSFCLFTSSILALTCAGMFANKIVRAQKLLSDAGLLSPYVFPYSLFLTGLGGVVAGFGFFVVVGQYIWKRTQVENEGPQRNSHQ